MRTAALAAVLSLAACSPSTSGDVAMKPKPKIECVGCDTPADPAMRAAHTTAIPPRATGASSS